MVNYESSLLVICWFPYGTCSLMILLEEAKLTWKDYLVISDNDHIDWEKPANYLDMSMPFIHRCNI